MKKSTKLWSILLCGMLLLNLLSVVVLAADTPAITAQPTDVTVQAGQTAVFKVTATGENLSYQWYQFSESGTYSISDGPGITGTETNTLTFSNVECYRDGQCFVCRVFNDNGYAESEYVFLEVSHANTLYTYSETSHKQLCADCGDVLAQAQDHRYGNDTTCDVCGYDTVTDPDSPIILTERGDDVYAENGEDVVLFVDAFGTNLEYTWLLNDEPLPAEEKFVVNGNTLTIKGYRGNCDLNDATITVEIKNANDQVLVMPYFTVMHENDEWTAEPHVHYRKCTYCEDKADYSVHTDYDLDGKCDTCSFDFVAAGAPVITAAPQDVKIKNGQDATFKVVATGSNLTYEWYDLFYDLGEERINAEGADTDTLVLRSIYDPEGGCYDCAYNSYMYCVISNQYGSVETDLAAYEVEHQGIGGYEGVDGFYHNVLCECETYIDFLLHADDDADGLCDDCTAKIKAPFVDVTDLKEWYYEAVTFGFSYGMFVGDENGNFNPTNQITRGEVAVVLANALFGYGGDYGLSTLTEREFEQEIQRVKELSGLNVLPAFSDIPADAYYNRHARLLSAAGLFVGDEHSNFNGGAKITRQELTILFHSVDQLLREVSEIDDDVYYGDPVETYKDEALVADWAKPSVEWAKQVGMFQGDGAGYFNPTNTATRAEMAQLMMNLLVAIL